MYRLYSLYLILTLLILSVSNKSIAQNQENLPGKSFLIPSDTLNKGRVILISSGLAVGYASSLVLLNEYWYKNYAKTQFHFFNDNAEWMQMDKAGHVFNSYYLSKWCIDLFKWTGMKNKKAAWIGGLSGHLLLTTIEVLDGFSEKWGASPGDIFANTIGSGLAISQALIWEEQRIQIKMSVMPKSYSMDVRKRATDLYGNTFAETVLKDYNALTIWASVNPYSFIKNKNTKFPRWLNIAFGYGAEGIYGGYENKWCQDKNYSTVNCPGDELIDRTDIRRYRQYFLSLDVDLTKIRSRSPLIRTLLGIANIIKIPAPALEVNEKGQVKFHAVYF